MGNLGFLFNIEEKQMVVFTHSKKFEGNIILGEENINLENTNFLFLSKNLKLEKFHIFDDFKFKHSKIRVFNQRIVDFEDFVFYLKPKEYKKIRNLFEIEDEFNDEILIKKVLEIYEIFN